MMPQWDAEELYKRTPSPATLPGDAYVPVLVSVVLGVCLGAAPGALLLTFGAPWWILPVCMASAAGCALLWRVRVHDAARWATERERRAMRGADPAWSAPVVLDPMRGREAARAQLATERMQAFIAFVESVEREGDSSSRRWERQLGRPQYAAFRDRLLASGFARQRSASPKDGWELIVPASTVIAALTPTHAGLLPPGDD